MTTQNEIWKRLEIPEDFHTPYVIYPDREQEVIAMKNFVTGKLERKKWCMYIYGPPRSGKSALAAVSLHYFFVTHTNVSALYLPARFFFLRLKGLFNDNVASCDYLNKLFNVDLLVFDDFGSGLGSKWELNETYGLLDARHMLKKKTIITSNLSLEDAKEYTDDRIYGRLKEGEVFKLEKSKWHGKENFCQKNSSNSQSLDTINLRRRPVQPLQYKDDD